jgi:hypothetical protein
MLRVGSKYLAASVPPGQCSRRKSQFNQREATPGFFHMNRSFSVKI